MGRVCNGDVCEKGVGRVCVGVSVCVCVCVGRVYGGGVCEKDV